MILRFSFLALLFLSCNSGDHLHNNGLQIIDASIDDRTYSIDQLIEDVEYIPLTEREGILLSNIKQLFISDSLYIILNYYSSSIKFFNSDGTFLWETDSRSEGELGFSSISNIHVSYNGLIYFTDIIKNKILVYSINERMIIDEIKCEGYSPYGLGTLNDRLVVITNDISNGFIKLFNIYDKSLKWTGIFEPQYVNSVITHQPIFSNKKNILISVGFTDTIYSIFNDRIIPFSVVGKDDRSLHSIDYEAYVLDYTDGNSSRYNENLLIPFGNISFNNEIWFIELTGRDKILIWNNNLKKSVLLTKKNVKKWQLAFYPILFGIFDFDEEGYAYSQIMPNDDFFNTVAIYLEETSESPLAKHLRELLKTLDTFNTYENPIIVKFKLSKEFNQIFS